MPKMSAIEIVPGAARVRGFSLMAAAVAIYVVLRIIGFHKLFADDAEGIDVLLQIIGTLYSVVYAFATFVIWGQFAAVENEILQEAGALKDLVIFSRGIKEATRDPVVRARRAYPRGVIESEWATLSRGEHTEKTDKLFSAIISSVTEVKPDGEGERSIYERLLEIANQASTHREERLAISAKRMPGTLFLFVTLTAIAILFLLFFYPFHNLGLGIVAIALATMLLFFAHFVLTDLDNPFEGTWNVSSQPFHDLISKCH
jgi:hypothetical protein